MLSSTIIEYKALRKALKPILEGVLISVDPSCGSDDGKGGGSNPGYAVFRSGVLVESGTIKLDATQDLVYRLQTLAWELRKVYNKYSPDVLIYEAITPFRHLPGRRIGSNSSLLKALGVVMSMAGHTQAVGLRPMIWKKQISKSYLKSDEGDAIEMGKIALENAAWIVENDCPRNYGGKISKDRSPVSMQKVLKKPPAKKKAAKKPRVTKKGDLDGYRQTRKTTESTDLRADGKSNPKSRPRSPRKPKG